MPFDIRFSDDFDRFGENGAKADPKTTSNESKTITVFNVENVPREGSLGTLLSLGRILRAQVVRWL